MKKALERCKEYDELIYYQVCIEPHLEEKPPLTINGKEPDFPESWQITIRARSGEWRGARFIYWDKIKWELDINGRIYPGTFDYRNNSFVTDKEIDNE